MPPCSSSRSRAYCRRVSSTWYRVVSTPDSSAITIDFATSPASASTTSHTSTPSPAAIAVAAVGVEGAREHTETVEHHALGLVEQGVRPVDGSAQRLVALHRGAPPSRQQPEPLVEQVRDLPRRHGDDSRRRELDRQRDAVEPAADLRDRGDVAGLDR